MGCRQPPETEPAIQTGNAAETLFIDRHADSPEKPGDYKTSLRADHCIRPSPQPRLCFNMAPFPRRTGAVMTAPALSPTLELACELINRPP